MRGRVVSVQINKGIILDMISRVFRRGEKFLNNKLNRVLLHTKGILQFLGQLDNLLTRYGGNTAVVNAVLLIKIMSQSIQRIDADIVGSIRPCSL